MASKRRIRRKTCENKATYRSHIEATKQSASLTFRQRSPVSAYKCQFCQKWHIGHTPARVAEAKRSRYDE